MGKSTISMAMFNSKTVNKLPEGYDVDIKDPTKSSTNSEPRFHGDLPPNKTYQLINWLSQAESNVRQFQTHLPQQTSNSRTR